MSFADLHLPPEIIAALGKQQIVEPTPIQIAALPILLAGEDAYLHAETGTGKTLAYLVPLYCRIDAAEAATQAIIVAPTHELAIQIQRQCSELAQNSGLPIRTILLIGGTPLDRQIEKLKKKPHVVVGSPGRIAELIEKGKLKTKFLRSVVIDEADRLLSDESFTAVRSIIQDAPVTRQLIFASATQEPQTIDALTVLAPRVRMLEAGAAAVNQNIEHWYLICEERDKPDELRKLLHALNPERAIVFVHRNDVAARIAAKLAHHHIPVADLSGSLHKEDRKAAMDAFRSGALNVLIASDIAARGLDIKGVTHIFNFDAPTLSKAYLHRVGRTGRAGAKGTGISLLTETEARVVRRYETELGIRLQRVRMREGRVLPVD
jgi:superfamily II DNA/RNA helicase